MRKYLFIIAAALIILSIINHRSIDKAVELCEEGNASGGEGSFCF